MEALTYLISSAVPITKCCYSHESKAVAISHFKASLGLSFLTNLFFLLTHLDVTFFKIRQQTNFKNRVNE